MAKLMFRRPNISRVVTKLFVTLISLWVGGTIMDALGDVMNGTTSGFYNGLSLIGWTVSSNTITATDDGAILGVIGIIGLGSVVMEFVSVSY